MKFIVRNENPMAMKSHLSICATRGAEPLWLGIVQALTGDFRNRQISAWVTQRGTQDGTAPERGPGLQDDPRNPLFLDHPGGLGQIPQCPVMQIGDQGLPDPDAVNDVAPIWQNSFHLFKIDQPPS